MSESVLETRRCRLLPLEAGDRPLLEGLYASEEARRFLGGILTGPELEARIKAFLVPRHPPEHWVCRLRETGEAAGLVHLNPTPSEREYELSYQFLPAFWGRGLASESAATVIEWALSERGAGSILAETQTGNTRSRRLLENLGFQSVEQVTRFGAKQTVYRLEGQPSRPAPERDSC